MDALASARAATDTNRLGDLFQAEPYTDRTYLHKNGQVLDGNNPLLTAATSLGPGKVGFQGVNGYASILAAPMSIEGNTITLTSPEYTYNPFYLRGGAQPTDKVAITSEITRTVGAFDNRPVALNLGGREVPVDTQGQPEYGFLVELNAKSITDGFITQVGTVLHETEGRLEPVERGGPQELQAGDWIYVDGSYANMQAGVLTSTTRINLKRSWELDQNMQLAAAPDGNAIVLHNDPRPSDQVHGAQEGQYLGIYPGGTEAGIRNGLALELDNSNNKGIDPKFAGPDNDYYNNNVHAALHPTGRLDAQNKNILLSSENTAQEDTYWALGTLPAALVGGSVANPAYARVKMTWYAAGDQSQPAWLWSYTSASAGAHAWSQQWEDGQRAAGSLESFAWPEDAEDLQPSGLYHLVVELYAAENRNSISDISDAVWKGQPTKVMRLTLTEGEVVDLFTNDYRVGAGAASTATDWDWTARLSYACATNYTAAVPGTERGGGHIDTLTITTPKFPAYRLNAGATTTTFTSFAYMGFKPQAGIQTAQVEGSEQMRPVSQGETVTFTYTVRNRRLTKATNEVSVTSLLTLPEEFFQNFDRGSVRVTSIRQHDPAKPTEDGDDEILAQVNALNGGDASAALRSSQGLVFELVGNPMTFTITAQAKDTLGQPWGPDSDPAVLAVKVEEKDKLLGDDSGSVTVHAGVDTVDITVDPWDYLKTEKYISRISGEGRTFDCTIRAKLPEFLPDEVVQKAFGKVRAEHYDAVLVIDNRSPSEMERSAAGAKEYLRALQERIHSYEDNPEVFQKISQTRVGIVTYGGDVAVPLTPFHNPDGGCAEPFIDALNDILQGSYPSMLGSDAQDADYRAEFSIPANPERYRNPVDTSACGGFAVGNHLLAMQMGLDSPLERQTTGAGKPDGLTYSTANQGNYYYSKVLLFHPDGKASAFQKEHMAPQDMAQDMVAALSKVRVPMPAIRDFTVYDEIDGHFYPTHEFSQEPSSFNESFVRWDGQNITGGQTRLWTATVRARSSFPGGNMVPTNTADSCLMKEGKNSIWLPIPTANVQLRPLKSYCEEQFLFYGQTLEAAGDLRAFLLEKHYKLNDYGVDDAYGYLDCRLEGDETLVSAMPAENTNYVYHIDYQPYTLGDRMLMLGIARIEGADTLVRTGNGRYLDPVGNVLPGYARARTDNVLSVRVAKGQIDLAVESGDGAAIPPNQSFLFRITRQAGSRREVFYEAVQGEGSKTVSGLKWGTYTVEQLENWSWRYGTAGYLDENPGSARNDPEDATVVLGERCTWAPEKITAARQYTGAAGTDTAARVSVSVELQNEQWLSDPTFAVNMGGGQEG